MPLDDATRLRHMLEAAEEAVGFAAGRTRAELDRERMLSLALVRLIEVIGEAAANVTPAMRSVHPEGDDLDRSSGTHRPASAHCSSLMDGSMVDHQRFRRRFHLSLSRQGE